MRPRQTRQRDLFETDRPAAEILAAQRMTLVRLIECLLVEAVAECEAVAQSDGLETREAGHEQDSPEHLARQAVVYIRQSTADQVANNLES